MKKSEQQSLKNFYQDSYKKLIEAQENELRSTTEKDKNFYQGRMNGIAIMLCDLDTQFPGLMSKSLCGK